MLDLEIEHLPVETLIPYARNARTHSDEQISQIAGSITEFGFVNPILIGEDNVIIAGHGRLMAAQRLGLPTVPVIMLAHLSETQRRALVLADNKIAENAGWDEKLLSLELLALQDDHFDLSMIGFSDEEISDLLQDENTGEELTDPDDVPEAPANPVTQSGDIWLLGEHRLMCGDSTSMHAVDSLMDGGKADIVFTDPPYGMSYGGGRAAGDHSLDRKTGGVKDKAHGMIMNDELQGDDLLQLVRDALTSAKIVTKEGAAVYTCFTWRTYAEFQSALLDAGLEVKNCIVWDKKSIGLGNSHYRPQHEFIFYSGGKWYGDKSESDVWYMSRGATGNYVHPTQKPVELIERALNNSSKKGDTVIDVFGGSGSTLIACEKTGRRSRLMELDPKYCDVIIKRWQEFTGKKAILESKGQSFDDIELQKQEAPLLEGV